MIRRYNIFATLFIYITCFVFSLQATERPHIQKGLVVTQDSIGDSLFYRGLEDVCIKIIGTEETVTSDKNGLFVFEIGKEDTTFILHSVNKDGYVLVNNNDLSNTYHITNDTLQLVMEPIHVQAVRMNNAQKDLHLFINTKLNEDTTILFNSIIKEDILSRELQSLYLMRNFRERVLFDEETPITYCHQLLGHREDTTEFKKRIFTSMLLNPVHLNLAMLSSSFIARFQNTKLKETIKKITKSAPNISRSASYLSLGYTFSNLLFTNTSLLITPPDLNRLTSQCLIGYLDKKNLDEHFSIQEKLLRQLANDSTTISSILLIAFYQSGYILKDEMFVPDALDGLHYYKEYARHLLENDLDGAEESIIKRAELDSTNVQRNMDAGKFLMWRDKVDKALKYFLLAKHFYKTSSIRKESIYKELGNVYSAMLDYGNAFDYFKKADSVICVSKNFTHIDYIKNHIKLINVLTSMDSLTTAKKELLQINATVQNSYKNDCHLLSQMNNNLGAIFEKIGVKNGDKSLFLEASKYYLKAENILKENIYSEGSSYKNDLDIAIYNNNLGSCKERLGEYSISRNYYSEAEEIYKNVYGESVYWTQANVGILQNNIASTFYSEHNYNAALIYYLRALKIMRNIYHDNNHPIIRTILENISQVTDDINTDNLRIENQL